MEPAYFYNFVLPLGVLVGVLAILVLHYARGEERHKKQFQKLLRKHVEDRVKQEKKFTEEVGKLDVLLRDKSIDKNTYARLRKILEISFAKQRDKVRTQLEAKA
jgi:rubrerythrin